MLTPALDRYLELRRALGYKLNSQEHLLRSYVRFADNRADEHLRRSTALEWTQQSTTARQSERRMRLVIGFAQFLHAEDPRHEIPIGKRACSLQPRPLPHIFSADELRRLSNAAAQLDPPGSMRPLTFGTLFNLLAATGLRISEALSLRLDDLTPDGLMIRDTKFHKSRLVPLHGTAAAALTQYLDRRLRVNSKFDNLFISLKLTPLCYHTASKMFRQLCISAGLRSTEQAHGPRLHDLRHTLAVRALESCPHARDQVTPHMLALSTYLGHGSARGTYWYLQSSPQLMHDVADAGEAWLLGGREQ